MFAIIAPGQGSQTPGMLAGWLRDPVYAERVRAWSEAADVDLVHLGTRAPAAEIARTEHTQPLLVAQGVLAHEALAPAAAGRTVVAAGHSVGELTAAVYAGVLTPVDAVRLAAIRGRAMAAACAEAPTSMAAVVGGTEAEVLARIAGLGLTAATFNGPGQIVAAGLTADLERLAAAPPPGATVKPLAVAGAFHTPYMESARQAFAAAAEATRFAPPRGLLLSNADGEVLATPEVIRRRLVEQVVRPVRWNLCLLGLARLAPGLTVSLPPAKTLTAILRRQHPELAVLPVGSARDIGKVHARLTTTAPTLATPTATAPTHTAPTLATPTATAPTHTAPTPVTPTATAPTTPAADTEAPAAPAAPAARKEEPAHAGV
ncbi:ACP S-malonyltransferase [Streptomyces sp. NPDC004065]|uniref:ACP S-malonyltransferase n=1 Tax=Streptomyces sp. NPDC004065 TaxID=3364689 RepID=UPI00384F1A26